MMPEDPMKPTRKNQYPGLSIIPQGGGASHLPTLQARYLEVVGRPTGSGNKAYLIWKIGEAQKGHIPVGPRKNAHREGVSFKVLPLRMEADLVEKLDEAWRRQRLHSRTELFRRSLQAFLENGGGAEVDAMFAAG
jgi:hypothetical protein